MIDAAEVVRFLAAFAVIGLALFAFAMLSRSGGRMRVFLGRSRGRIVEVIETTPLPHAGSLHLVKVADAYFVIGRTDHAIALLSEVPGEAIERLIVQTPSGSRLFPSHPR